MIIDKDNQGRTIDKDNQGRTIIPLDNSETEMLKHALGVMEFKPIKVKILLRRVAAGRVFLTFEADDEDGS